MQKWREISLSKTNFYLLHAINTLLVESLNVSKMISYFNNLKELLGLRPVLQLFGHEVEWLKYDSWE